MVFTKENANFFLRKRSSLFFLQELRPLTPLKATNRFKSLTVIGMMAIMCNTSQSGSWESLPQELIRIWGRVPIFKTSRPDHEMGIWTHATFLRKERKR
jgi:hypothetical protein